MKRKKIMLLHRDSPNESLFCIYSIYAVLKNVELIFFIVHSFILTQLNSMKKHEVYS